MIALIAYQMNTLDDEINEFFDVDDGAIEVLYVPRGGELDDAVEFRGILQKQLIEASFDGVNVYDARITFLTPSANVPHPNEGDELLVGTITYRALSYADDLNGVLTFFLEVLDA